MTNNIETSEKLNSQLESISFDKGVKISSDDIDRLNELQRLTNNSYSKVK